MKVVCIGNSIVNGFPFQRSKSFSSVLREETGWEVINKGINGQSTDEIKERFSIDALKHKPDKIVILSGANDFIFSINEPEEAIKNYEEMAKGAKEAGVQVYLAAPLLTDAPQASEFWATGVDVDYNVVNEKLKKFRELILESAKALNVDFIDLQKKYETFAQYVDGVHPTEEGQRFLADLLIKNL